MLINMHEPCKVSTEIYGHPLQGSWLRWRPCHQGHCLLYNPLLLKSRTSVLSCNSSYMTTEISVISIVLSLNKTNILKTHTIFSFFVWQYHYFWVNENATIPSLEIYINWILLSLIFISGQNVSPLNRSHLCTFTSNFLKVCNRNCYSL